MATERTQCRQSQGQFPLLTSPKDIRAPGDRSCVRAAWLVGVTAGCNVFSRCRAMTARADSITCCVTSAPPPSVLSQSNADSATCETESHSPVICRADGCAATRHTSSSGKPIEALVSRPMSKGRSTLNSRIPTGSRLGRRTWLSSVPAPASCKVAEVSGRSPLPATHSASFDHQTELPAPNRVPSIEWLECPKDSSMTRMSKDISSE